MKLSMMWLRKWVACQLTEQELADQLTMAGLEVDSVTPVAGAFTQVVVAEVLATRRHPDADKLTLCEVNANTDKILNIVCGAANVRPGIKVALAKVGAKLPGGITIKESKLRGELSQGMLCSVSELGLAEQSDGIMELDANAPVGTDLREYLGLDDYVLDIDLTPNRADCFSVLGIAREVAALNKLPMKALEITTLTPAIDDVLSVNVVHTQACPRYTGRVIRGINSNASTPLWMAESLRRCGIRLIHPIVDITNYVMMELGQPMHAFDLSEIDGAINVRFAHDKEQLLLLDGQDVVLNDKVLVIADDKKALGLAGVMGGEHSSVKENTKDIFLESAFFSPQHIAGVARKFSLSSDSSQRFERGVDPYLQVKALERATALVLEIAGGQAGPVIECVDNEFVPKKVSIKFDSSKVRRLTGLDISVQEMKELLESIGLQCTKVDNAVFDVQVPTHRFDLLLDVDLVEEIIRLYGYDHVTAQPMSAEVRAGKPSDNERIGAMLTSWFKARGYHETISYSFVDPEVQEELYPGKEFMRLLNPISSELSQMRAGLWPGLIASMVHNVHRQQNSIQLFEIGVVFDLEQDKLSERACIAGLLMGEKGALNWSEATRTFDFFDLKGDLQSLFNTLKLTEVTFVPKEHNALHPGQSAAIIIGNEHAGWVGTLHPRITDALDLQCDVVLFELDVKKLINFNEMRYRPISKYPQIRRDLSFLVDNQVSSLDIENVVHSNIKENWLKAFDIFDVYTGTGIPEGKKSLAISLLLQDDGRTLVDSEINSLISAIIESLETKFSIILRD